MVHWKEMAEKYPILAAAELYFMAHPDKRVPWRQLIPLPPPDADPSPKKWGRKKRRSSRPIMEEEAPARKEAEEEKVLGGASPKSPLSWNGCEFPGISIRDSPAKRRTVTVGSSDRNSGGGGVLSGGRGSMKTVAELRGCERSLVEENMMLKREMEQQKLKRTVLTEENKRLNSLKERVETTTSKLQSVETKQKKRQLFPFDLNLPCPDDLDADTNCDSKQMLVDYKGNC